MTPNGCREQRRPSKQCGVARTRRSNPRQDSPLPRRRHWHAHGVMHLSEGSFDRTASSPIIALTRGQRQRLGLLVHFSRSSRRLILDQENPPETCSDRHSWLPTTSQSCYNHVLRRFLLLRSSVNANAISDIIEQALAPAKPDSPSG